MKTFKPTVRWADLPELLTVDEVAAFTRTSRGWVYEAVRSGPLKPAAVHLGRSIRLRKDLLSDTFDAMKVR